ncbi:MAG: hypothetical protein JSR29_20550 [Nitrospira sp.]|nr:hypothetical protein [Nitrospira sp.]
MMRRVYAGVGLIILLSGYLGFFVPDAHAIPAFSRKYDVSCNTCHVPSFPKLNDFGNRFRDSGYQMDSDDDLPTGLHMAYWPVSLRTSVGYQTSSINHLGVGNPATSTVGASTGGFGFTILDILAFGTIMKDVSYGVIYTPGLGSAGFGTGRTDGDLEAAFIRLNNVMGTSLLNIKVGKYELDLPFSEHRSPTLNTPFVMYHYRSGTPFSRITANPSGNPQYGNANDFALGDNQPGMELFGTKDIELVDGTFRYSLNVVSSNVTNVGGSGGGRALQFYGHATQSFKGYGIVDGQRIGVFGMFGRAPTAANPAIAGVDQNGTGEQSRTFSRIGVDFSLTALSKVNVFGAYMIANDSANLFRSQGILNAQASRWNGGFVEVDYNFVIPAVAYYRFDWIRNNFQGDPTFDKKFGNVESHTIAMRYHLYQSKRTALSFHGEFSHTKTTKTGAFGEDQVARVGFVGMDFSF